LEAAPGVGGRPPEPEPEAEGLVLVAAVLGMISPPVFDPRTTPPDVFEASPCPTTATLVFDLDFFGLALMFVGPGLPGDDDAGEVW
jgi:hypothetical protein